MLDGSVRADGMRRGGSGASDIDEGRPAEAEAEVEAVLRAATRTMRLPSICELNCTLWCAWAISGLGEDKENRTFLLAPQRLKGPAEKAEQVARMVPDGRLVAGEPPAGPGDPLQDAHLGDEARGAPGDVLGHSGPVLPVPAVVIENVVDAAESAPRS
ncbi:hypothetical protein GCM10010343_11880 [Streptomyces avidinii]|nr:hypothetical protein GCM10010343_11880 [Streptomyces avidinii]